MTITLKTALSPEIRDAMMSGFAQLRNVAESGRLQSELADLARAATRDPRGSRRDGIRLASDVERLASLSHTAAQTLTLARPYIDDAADVLPQTLGEEMWNKALEMEADVSDATRAAHNLYQMHDGARGTGPVDAALLAVQALQRDAVGARSMLSGVLQADDAFRAAARDDSRSPDWLRARASA